jgi:carbon storage regulator CsrA
MLVLSRRPGESVVLPDLGVTVVVSSVRNGVVRLGIEAPPEVAVLRQELVGRPRTLARGSAIHQALNKPR